MSRLNLNINTRVRQLIRLHKFVRRAFQHAFHFLDRRPLDFLEFINRIEYDSPVLVVISQNLGYLDRLPRMVAQPRKLDYDVHGRAYLTLYRLQRQVRATPQNHRLKPAEHILRGIRVARGQRTVMARVHRLEHVYRLGPAHLAHDDPVRTHSQRRFYQILYGYLFRVFVRRDFRLEPDYVVY